MAPRFSASSRWPSRFGYAVLCLTYLSLEAFSQTTMNLSANAMQIQYEPPLSFFGGKHNNSANPDPSIGWVGTKSGSSIFAFTSSTSANATFTFFGDSIQVFADAVPPDSVPATAIVTLDDNTISVPPPYNNGLLFSAASLNAALPHTIVVSKSQESSDNSVVVISSISVVGFENVVVSSSTSEPPSLTAMSAPKPFGATSSATNQGLSNGVIAAIAISVTVVVLLLAGLLLFLRRRRRRLAHQVDPLVIDPPKRPQTRHRPLPHIRTRLPHYRAPPSINPPSSPGTTVAHQPRALEGIVEGEVGRDDGEPETYSTLPPLSILRPPTPPPQPDGSPAPTKRRSLFIANPSTLLPSFSFSSGKSRSHIVSVEKAEYGNEKEKPVIDFDPPPPAAQPSRSLRRFFTTNPGSSAYTTSSVSSSSSKKSKRNRSRSNSNTSSVPQMEDTAPPAPLLITQPQSPVLSVVEEEITQVKRARTSRPGSSKPTFYTANPTDEDDAGGRLEERYTSEVRGPRPNKGKKKASA